MKKRLVWMTYASHLAVAWLALLVAAVISIGVGRRAQVGQTHRMLDQALALAGVAVESADADAAQALCRRAAAATGHRFTLIAAAGRVLGDSEADPATLRGHGDRPEVIQALAVGHGSAVRFSASVHRDLLYAARRLETAQGPVVLRAATPLASLREQSAGIQRVILFSAALLALLAAAISLLKVLPINRAIRELCARAEALGRGDFSRHAPVTGVGDLDILADALNRLATHLKTQIGQVERQRDEWDALLRGMIEGVIAVDTQRRILRINQSAAVMFHVDPAACLGRGLLDVVRHADLAELFDRALAAPEPVEGMLALIEEGRHLRAHAAAMLDTGGRRLGALVVLHDVTSLHRLELMQREFVANVSHELKTPITSIKGFAETLLDGAAEDPESRARFLGIIVRQADRLQSIVEDTLALVSLEDEAARAGIEFQRRPIGPILDHAVTVCRAAADARRVTVTVECAPGLDADVHEAFLEQAIVNLVDNAVKYSEDGGPVRVSAGTDGAELRIAVSDRGAGIPATHLERIFERFYRVDKSRSRKQGGTGLGLAIVKRVAVLHGGRVAVESRLGEGSTFTLCLPRSRPRPPRAEA